MNINGSSDLARSLLLQRQVVTTREALERSGKELSTGLKSSSHAATGGDLNRLFALERSLARNATFQNTLAETEMRIDIAQDGVGQILSQAESLSLSLVSAAGSGDRTSAGIHAKHARAAFGQAVAVLNTQVAGRSLFAGTATGGPALASADAMLAELDALVAGAPDAAQAIAAVNEYFASTSPGGFHTGGYLGSGQDLSPADLGENTRLAYGVRADAEELVSVLRGHAMAAVVAGGALAGAPAEQMAVLAEAGKQLLAAKEGILDLRARVGVSQNIVEDAKAQRQAEREAFEMARAKIMSADPYATAAEFEALSGQIEATYAVTARLSSLRFTNYLR